MKKLIKILSIILAITMMLGGCQSTNNLNDLTVVQALGIDDYDGNTKVTIQYLDTNVSGTATDALNGNITSTGSGTSDNISDALSDAAKSLSQKIFMGQNKIIVFGSSYASQGIDKGFDYLIRSVDSRPDVLVAMSNTSAQEIVENEENGCRIPAENIYDLLDLGEENGLGAVMSVNDVLNLYQDETTDVYLPVLESNDDGVSCEGVVCFSDEKMAVSLDENQTFGFLFIKNRIKGGSFVIDNEKFGVIGIEIVKSNCKNSVECDGDNIIFNTKISVNALLNELEKGSTSDLTENEIIKIESQINDKIKSLVESAFYDCISAKSDPFGIGRYLAKDNAEIYDSVKQNWHEELSKIKLNVEVDGKLKNINDNNFRK